MLGPSTSSGTAFKLEMPLGDFFTHWNVGCASLDGFWEWTCRSGNHQIERDNNLGHVMDPKA